MVDRNQIEAQLERILKSDSFAKAEKLQSLLSYLVEQTLLGLEDRLKGYSIAVDVFGRDPDTFDSSTDSIVRVQVGRLRSNLDAYYRSPEGRASTLRIDVPKGGYAATFSAQESIAPVASRAVDCDSHAEAASLENSQGQYVPQLRYPLAWLICVFVLAGTVFMLSHVLDQRDDHESDMLNAAQAQRGQEGIAILVVPFADLTPEGERRGDATGFTQDLVASLSRIGELRVWSADTGPDSEDLVETDRLQSGYRPASFRLEGGLRRHDEGVRATIRLVDVNTGETVWSDTYDRDGGEVMAMQDEILDAIAMDIRPQIYVAARRDIENRATEDATAWELFLQATFVPGSGVDTRVWELERLALARRAIELDPTFGEEHSVIADKLTYLAMVDPPSDTPERLAEAEFHAQQAQEQARSNPDAMFNVALFYYRTGQLDRAVSLMDRIVSIDPNHVLARFELLAMPHICQKPPPDTLDEARALDLSLPADHPARWVLLSETATMQIDAGHFGEALKLHQRLETMVSNPLIRMQHAALLVRLGRWDEAVSMLEPYRETWPNLDAGHTANTVIPRLCQGRANQDMLQGLYRDLDRVLKTAGQE